MHPTVKQARVAGWLYVLMGAPAPFALIYLPNTLMVPGNATATAGNILAFEKMLRLGIVAELMSAAFFVLLVLALYRLLSKVNEHHARLMVSLVLVSVAITFVGVVNNLAALTLATGGDFLSAFDKPQRDALATLFLHLHGEGATVNQILWGLWLLPFGVLVMRSDFIPRILGVLLIVNGVAYVILSLISLLLPTYEKLAFNASMPALLGELWIMLWLLIKGARVQATPATPA